MVATDWTALGLATIGVAGTIGGGFVGAWIQGRHQEQMERQRQQERAAEVVGVVWQLHLDTAPDLLAIDRVEGQATEAVMELMKRHDAVHPRLTMLGAWYPSAKVRDLALEASVAMHGALDASVKYIRDYFKEPGEGASLEEAERAYKEAQDVLVKLMLAIREG
jgi:hypothetical protein